MNDKKIKETLDSFYTQVEDLSPLDYTYYSTRDEDKEFPEMPEGTVVLSSGLGPEDEDQIVVRTPDNIYYLVNEYEEEPTTEFDEVLIELITQDVDPNSGGFYTLTKKFVEKVYKI
jgi:hypothetical protein